MTPASQAATERQKLPRRLGAAAEVTRVGVLDQAEDVGVDHRRRYLIHERAA